MFYYWFMMNLCCEDDYFQCSHSVPTLEILTGFLDKEYAIQEWEREWERRTVWDEEGRW